MTSSATPSTCSNEATQSGNSPVSVMDMETYIAHVAHDKLFELSLLCFTAICTHALLPFAHKDGNPECKTLREQ